MLNEFLRDPDFAIFINQRILKSDEGLIRESMVESAFASIDYYKYELESLCSVYRGLIKNHPFIDGNKRTAAIYLIIGLDILGFKVDQDLISDLTLDVAIHQYEVSEIAKKLKSIIIIK